MKAILSVGIGRLHFCEVNLALKSASVDRKMICGWLPPKQLKPLVNLGGRLIGQQNLYISLNRRFMNGQLGRDDFETLALPEIFSGLTRQLSDWKLMPVDRGQTLAWSFFGKASIPILKNANIFHVRSGAGQGGAIKAAKAAGMKVIVDQSIAHPAYMDAAIGPEYGRVGVKKSKILDSSFWQLVLKDCEEADLLLVNSGFVKQTFVDQGYPQDKIQVEHLGIPNYFYGAKKSWERVSKERLELLYTGGLVLRKGVRSLLEALKILRERKISFRMTFAGDTSEAFRYFSQELKSPDINLTGFLPRENLKELIQQSDLYVFPTLSEGCAQSAMEALGAGLPVITTQACGLPGQAGEHYSSVEVNAPKALADKIELLANDAALREQFGRAGTTLLEDRYTWQNYGEKLKSIYGNLLE